MVQITSKYIVIPILTIFIFLSTYDAFALTSKYPVENLSIQQSTTFSSIKDTYQYFEKQTKSVRRDFETNKDYLRRVTKYKAEFNTFLSYSYIAKFPPDRVSLDWANSLVNIKIHTPGTFLRKRGNSLNNQLSISIPVSPEEARLMSTFQNLFVIKIRFSLTERGEFLIEEMKIIFNNKEIYSEQ